MKNKEIHKIQQVILLLNSEKENLLTLEANYGIEKPYILRGAKIFKILKEEKSPEEDPNFLPYVKTEKIGAKNEK